jgi:isochorismate hydrolase
MTKSQPDICNEKHGALMNKILIRIILGTFSVVSVFAVPFGAFLMGIKTDIIENNTMLKDRLQESKIKVVMTSQPECITMEKLAKENK